MVDLFFELLQVALGNRDRLSRTPSEKEWYELFSMSEKQSVGAFVFTALDALSQVGQKPPMGLLYEWIGLAEQVKTQNALMNQEAARLTRLFEQAGHKTAILKGQANARLYPQVWSRQPGDIDIWVDGGRKKVTATTLALGMQNPKANYHHLDLPKNENGIEVEVHFRPSSGNKNPFTNKPLQHFLEKEISSECLLVEEGFRVPSVRFAIVMQLAHIQRHLLSEGVGLRQVIDFYYLLKSDDQNQRSDVSHRLSSFGIDHIAGALMWLLHEKLGLEQEYLISPIDEQRGEMLFQAILKGGNFGHYLSEDLKRGSLRRIYAKHKHRFQMLQFDPPEVICIELDRILYILKTIPQRIQNRTLSLE